MASEVCQCFQRLNTLGFLKGANGSKGLFMGASGKRSPPVPSHAQTMLSRCVLRQACLTPATSRKICAVWNSSLGFCEIFFSPPLNSARKTPSPPQLRQKGQPNFFANWAQQKASPNKRNAFSTQTFLALEEKVEDGRRPDEADQANGFVTRAAGDLLRVLVTPARVPPLTCYQCSSHHARMLQAKTRAAKIPRR